MFKIKTKDDKKYNKLKDRLKLAIKINNKINIKISKLHKKQISEWDLDREISKISHLFSRNDIIVLKSKKIAKIIKLIGRKHYKIFVSCPFLSGECGTNKIIHERYILCHAMKLVLTDKDCHFKYGIRNKSKFGDKIGD